MNERYDEIITLPHHSSDTRRKMSQHDRAAQFAPYAALSGYEGAVAERARLTEERIYLDEYEVERLEIRLRMLRDGIGCDRVAITYFVPDKRKSGGAYITVTDTVKRIDEYERKIIMSDGNIIPMEEIINIEECFE